MHTSRIAFATFAPEHLDGAVRLSRQAGWPDRREDWATVLALSTGFVAEGLAQVGGGIAMQRGGETPDRQSGVQTFALASQALG